MEDFKRLAKKITAVLFLVQSFGSAGFIAVFTVNALVGVELTGQRFLAGVPEAVRVLGQAFTALSGNGTMAGLSGPVGIAAIAGRAASRGLLSLFYFTGVLSMSLGIMNLLPLPALDGGHLILLLIESIKRKPLSPKAYQVIMLIGLSLFLILTLVVTYQDIVKLIA